MQRFAAPDVTPRPQPGLRGVAIVMCAVLAIVVDQTSTAIINTGLPYLAGITAASPDESSWILTCFNAPYYAFILLSPWMMARFGRRRLMIAALLGFAVLSLLLAATTDYALFLVLRFAQGACLGCIFVPAALLLFTSLPPRALKFAPPAFVLLSLSAATFGTVIGGYVADEFGGNLVFLPGGVATALTALAIFLAVNTPDIPQPALRFDAAGVALSIATFGAMQYLANEGERRNWFDDGAVVAGAVLLVVVAAGFVAYEMFVTRDPHVDFRMFARHRNLSVGATINVAIGAVGYSITLFVGYLQTSIGVTPTVAGALILVRVLTYALGVPAAFFLITSRILDLRAVVITGVLGSAVALLAFAHSMTTTAETASFIGLSLIFGVFFGMTNQPLGALVIGSMPLPLLAAGVSIYKLSSPVGLMIATGGIASVLDHRSAFFRSNIAGDIALARAPVGRYVAAHHGDVAGLVAFAAAQAQVLAYAYAMSLLALVILVVVPIVFLAKVQKPAARTTNV